MHDVILSSKSLNLKTMSHKYRCDSYFVVYVVYIIFGAKLLVKLFPPSVGFLNFN